MIYKTLQNLRIIYAYNIENFLEVRIERLFSITLSYHCYIVRNHTVNTYIMTNENDMVITVLKEYHKFVERIYFKKDIYCLRYCIYFTVFYCYFVGP